MGILCSIYRSGMGDCSLNGISSKVQTVCLIDASGPFEPTKDRPAVKLVKRNIGGKPYIHAVPVWAEGKEPKGCVMAGGCFIYTSDSRYNEAVGYSQPIALHDRYEA